MASKDNYQNCDPRFLVFVVGVWRLGCRDESFRDTCPLVAVSLA